MGYKLTKETLAEYEEGRIMAVVTHRSSQGEIVTEEEITEELGVDKEAVDAIIKGLIIKGKIKEVLEND